MKRTTKPGLRKGLVRLLALAVSCVVALALLEGLATAYAWFRFGTVDVTELLARETGNSYTVEIEKHNETYARTLYPHPYLAFVRSREIEKTMRRRLNNVGLMGPDFPIEKDSSKFTILLTGGSVANHLGCATDGEVTYLEEILNEQYDFGREVVVLNGANGSWNQPQQAIVSLLYGEIADAVVTLDGFNENTQCRGNSVRLELPSVGPYVDMNPVAEHGYDRLAAVAIAAKLKQISINHPWRTIYLLTNALRSQLDQGTAVTETQLYDMFSLPPQWPPDRRIAFNVAQYKKYIRSIHALARLNGAKSAHFIQPCPAIGKKLTTEEKQAVGNLDYAGSYQAMTNELLALQKEDISVISLLDLFDDVSNTIYADSIHCRTYGSERKPSSPGYRKMAEIVAEQLAQLWSIPRADAKN